MEIITDRSMLKRPSEPVQPSESALGIFSALRETLEASVTGIGLAAIQIGIAKCCFITRRKHNDTWIYNEFENPSIIEFSNPFIYSGESCLSFPGVFVNTLRYHRITVLNGSLHEEPVIYTGIDAVVVQHEFDHLSGIVHYDREFKPVTVGRNEPCPSCLAQGKTVKFKKCSIHYMPSMQIP
jgi:peptide deformylase